MLRRAARRLADNRPGTPPPREPLTHQGAIEAMRQTAG
jgi:hypothetical protein